MSWLKSFIGLVAHTKDKESLYYKDYANEFFPPKKLTWRDLINLESKAGSEIFGPVPVGHRREFFNLDRDTWVWHESWTDASGAPKEHTIRYEVLPTRVIKVQAGLKYSVVRGEELQNFRRATQEYLRAISTRVYKTTV